MLNLCGAAVLCLNEGLGYFRASFSIMLGLEVGIWLITSFVFPAGVSNIVLVLHLFVCWQL